MLVSPPSETARLFVVETLLRESVCAARELHEVLVTTQEGPLCTTQFPTCLNSIACVLEREAPKLGLDITTNNNVGSTGQAYYFTPTSELGALLSKHVGMCSAPSTDALLADLRDILCALYEALAELPDNTEDIRFFVAASVELMRREVQHRKDLASNNQTLTHRATCIVCDLKARYSFLNKHL